MSTLTKLEEKFETKRSKMDKRDHAEKLPTGENECDDDRSADNLPSKSLSKQIYSRDQYGKERKAPENK